MSLDAIIFVIFYTHTKILYNYDRRALVAKNLSQN